jgi:hypothetical protein
MGMDKSMRRFSVRQLTREFSSREAEDRVTFARAFFTTPAGRSWKPRAYQVASLRSKAARKVHCDGRDVGKTSEIEIVACWAALTQARKSMLIATQCENHLFPLMNRLARRFQARGFDDSIVELRRSPSWYFRFKNGFELWGRIAGPRGINFQGMHVDWQIVDEAQEMTDESWGELYQGLNGDGYRWVYGVPNGRRNVFYRMTKMADAEQYNWPSSLNPDFSEAKEAELAHLYGGRTSPGYLHRVLGRHGAPAYAVFNLEDYLACVGDTTEFDDIRLREDEAFAAPSAIARGIYYLGCDLGYAQDPSEYVVYRVDGPHLVNVLRVHLERVTYARQQQVIETLDAAYDFQGIGIDVGNSGRAVAHYLMALGHEWCAKIHAIEFGGMLDLEPLPDGRPNRRRAKEFMTELIQRRLAERALVLPPLADREEQYAAHTYCVGPSGQTVFEKGNDHLIDADRCALLCHYLDTSEHEPDGTPLRLRIESF